ncbi:MAG: sugar ABC transporter permease [Anaerolineae bacterium]|nr:sugar ABC transporter permease [Anaerolineae bacterium]
MLPNIVGADSWTTSWLNDRSKYEFNWHDIPTLSLMLVIGLTALFLFQHIRRRKFLSVFFVGVPVGVLYMWIASDWLTYDRANPTMHGLFDWRNVPQYVTAAIMIGFMVYMIHLLWQGHRKTALLVGIPTLIIFLWYVTGGPDSFPNVDYKEEYGFNIALIGILVPAVWQLSGYTMAIYLAGIRGIPEELREAARVDGCTEWQVYTLIILPMLRPVTLSAAIVLGHISLKIFDLIFAMVGTDYLPVSVPGVQVYTTMFRSNKFAVGSAIAMVLLVMVASVIIPYLATSLQSEHDM